MLSLTQMPNNQTKSAGGIVVDLQGEVLLVQEYGYYWGLPRGHIEPDETPLEAAKREITEEAGIRNLKLIKELGSYERYRFNKDGSENRSELKHITFFLFKTNEQILKPHDPNITAAEWVDPREVTKRFIHPKDIEFFDRCQTELALN